MTEDLYEAGLRVRRQVVGNAHVERSLAEADEFSGPLQDLVTRYCWGEIWRRPGLSRRDRSMINIAMISALNRPHELKLHIRGALNNGLSKDEIREILLQIAIYCGLPAALDGTRIAKEVFSSLQE